MVIGGENGTVRENLNRREQSRKEKNNRRAELKREGKTEQNRT